MAGPPEQDPLVELDAPLSSVEWSTAFVTQAIEVLFAYLAPDGLHHLHPVHAETLRLGWPPTEKPGQIVLDAAERYGLRPLLVHSTSWRHEEGRLVLTYVVAVAAPEVLDHDLADDLVDRAELARGDAFGPPPEVGVAQVLEHAFRHLAWLVKDDAVVGGTLSEWATFLARYEPEPFRAFGPSAAS